MQVGTRCADRRSPPLSNGSTLAREQLLPGLHRGGSGDVGATGGGLDLLLLEQLA